jgi:hypothetical protein
VQENKGASTSTTEIEKVAFFSLSSVPLTPLTLHSPFILPFSLFLPHPFLAFCSAKVKKNLNCWHFTKYFYSQCLITCKNKQKKNNIKLHVSEKKINAPLDIFPSIENYNE